VDQQTVQLLNDFAEWRNNKGNRWGRIPEHLWQTAIMIDRQNPSINIRDKCKLNKVQWMQRRQEVVATKTSLEKRPFVELLPERQAHVQQPIYSVELVLPSGITLRIR